ncbi:DUF7670 domain-containing protein [Phosphitispora sp. TUW77]|uniref:DUF7670 domain-containing protein n=1 Tax=Phosphitispora sp. TUW77 TaxID=3152361 RepID=UPI003AB4CFC3
MKKTGKILYWTPRILSILFICFLTLFSLDVFESGMSAGEVALGLFMHNIPSIIMVVLLVIAWRKEIVGAVGYFGAGLLYMGFVVFGVVNSGLPWYLAITWSLTIAGPAFIIGILFLLNWKKRKGNE